MLAAEVEGRPVGQPDAPRVGPCWLGRGVTAARLEQSLTQLLELLVFGMEGTQDVAGRLAASKGLQQTLGVPEAELDVDLLADGAGVEPAAAGVAGVLECCE